MSRAKCPVTRANRITELIALMVAKDLRPAGVVEGEGFKRLLSYLEPGFTIPSSVHVMDIVRHKFLAANWKKSCLQMSQSMESLLIFGPAFQAMPTYPLSPPAKKKALDTLFSLF